MFLYSKFEKMQNQDEPSLFKDWLEALKERLYIDIAPDKLDMTEMERERTAWDNFLRQNPIIKERIKRNEMLGSDKRQRGEE